MAAVQHVKATADEDFFGDHIESFWVADILLQEKKKHKPGGLANKKCALAAHCKLNWNSLGWTCGLTTQKTWFGHLRAIEGQVERRYGMFVLLLLDFIGQASAVKLDGADLVLI